MASRARLLRALRLLIPIFLSLHSLSHLAPLVLLVYRQVQSVRYLEGREIHVGKIGVWDPEFLQSVGEVRAKRLVRLDDTTYEAILAIISSHQNFKSILGKKPRLPARLSFDVFLCFLSTSGVGGSYFTISQRFGIGEGTVKVLVDRVIGALVEIAPRVIRWPSTEERAETKEWCSNRSGFADCIGFIDGTAFILLECPTLEGSAYFSRKLRYCIAGTAICDHNRRFIGFFVGETGSAHDARQLHQMDVYKDPSQFFVGDEYLLGDSGYPLREFLITPYKRPEADDIVHRRFNTQLSKARIRVEQSFGLLKERFCRLIDGFATVIATVEDHKFVCDCIMAAAVLHLPRCPRSNNGRAPRAGSSHSI